MTVIGITGTLGAGKGTIVDYLVQKKGFEHFSVRGYLIEEIKRRNMPVDRDSMTIVGNDLRAKYGAAYIVEQLYEQAISTAKNSIIESLRAVGEVEALKGKKDFHFFAVDADPKIRYERAVLRGSETDKISYERFLSDEKREMENDDPTKQNIAKCMQMADHVFTNNGSLEELNKQIEQVVEKLNI